MPRVSAIMPTYNHAKFVGKAIESVLGQTFQDWELLIADDASTDSTRQVLAAYDDPRIRVFYLPVNRGAGFARNHCLASARGEFIAICDSDDISLPDRFEKQVQILDAHGDVGVVASQVLDFDESQSPRVTLHYPSTPLEIKARFRRGRTPIPNASAMFRSELLKWAPEYAEQCRRAQDMEFFLRLVPHTEFMVIEEPLVMYRSPYRQASLKEWRYWSRYRRYAVYHASVAVTGRTPRSYEEFSQSERKNVTGVVVDIATFAKTKLIVLIQKPSTSQQDSRSRSISQVRRFAMIKRAWPLVFMLSPMPLKRVFARWVLHWEVHPTAYIGYTWIECDHLSMGEETRIDHFNLIRGLDQLEMGKGSLIAKFNWIVADRGARSTGSNKALYMERESAITHQHYIDCTGGVTLGAFSIIAGVRTSILSHQIDLAADLQSFAPVRIGCYTFVGSNVRVVAGAVVPDYCVVAMGAVVVNDLGEPGALYGGVPAKKLHSTGDGAWFKRASGRTPTRS